MNRLAIKVVDALIEGVGPHRRIPVKVRRGDQTLDCEFTGYYQHPKRGYVHSIGYPAPSGHGFSHGMLHPGDTLETPVPSPEEWEAERLAAEQAAAVPPAKASFWPTGGSGA